VIWKLAFCSLLNALLSWGSRLAYGAASHHIHNTNVTQPSRVHNDFMSRYPSISPEPRRTVTCIALHDGFYDRSCRTAHVISAYFRISWCSDGTCHETFRYYHRNASLLSLKRCDLVFTARELEILEEKRRCDRVSCERHDSRSPSSCRLARRWRAEAARERHDSRSPSSCRLAHRWRAEAARAALTGARYARAGRQERADKIGTDKGVY